MAYTLRDPGNGSRVIESLVGVIMLDMRCLPDHQCVTDGESEVDVSLRRHYPDQVGVRTAVSTHGRRYRIALSARSSELP